MIFEETTLGSERLYEGKILNLRVDKVATKDGGVSTREIVEHRGGAAAAALTGDGRIILVRQFRKPMEAPVLETPAGKIEPGEDPLETIRRELAEETGYTAGRIDFLTAMYPSVGYTNEIIYIYLARDLTPGEPAFDEHEAMDILEVDFAEAHNMVLRGEIRDAKTVIAILLTKNRLESGE